MVGCVPDDNADIGTDLPPVEDPSPDGPPEPMPPVEEEEGTPAVPISEWTPCSWIPGAEDGLAECAEAVLPLDHGDAESAGFPMLIKRRPASGQARVHMWLLHGGPGASAIDEMATLARSLVEVRTDVTFYALDHRGIGGSGRLSCPTQEAALSPGGNSLTDSEWTDCIEHLQARGDLPHITVSNSARDLGALIDTLSTDETRTIVYGGSYGTYLAQRYLQLFPQQPDGVILEGITTPEPSFTGYDGNMNAAGRALLATCTEDPSCRAHFGDRDPWEVAQSAVQALDQGHCPDLGIDASLARRLLGSMSFYGLIRGLIPAVVSRLSRCDIDDVAPLRGLVTFLSGLDPTRGNLGVGRSDALFYHVALSELLAPEADALSLYRDWQGYTMSTGLEVTLAAMQDRWPVFEKDALHGQFSDYEGPMLMFQGGLDAATPADRARILGEAYDGPHQHYVEFPQGAHDIIDATPTGSFDCARHLTEQFLDDPQSDLDKACVDEVLPIDFDGQADINRYIFGTSDAWGD